jgi:uncharacterized protein (TIGR03437 family)
MKFAGDIAFTLTVNGTNFVTGAKVRWNGNERETTVVNSTHLTAAIPATDIASVGIAQVTVLNPAPGGGVSNILNFTIEKRPEFEGDTAPRPFGDGKVSMADWVQAGRFFVGLDVPENASEFHRIDSAPRATGGDGVLSISDWVQTGRYAAGLDSVVSALGPNKPAAVATNLGSAPEASATEADTRMVRMVATDFQRGKLGVVQIEFDAQGNENGVSFSLNYDPKQMSFADAIIGAGATGAVVQINRSQLIAGRVGFAVALAPGQQFLPGTRQLLTLRFIPTGGESDVVTNLSFSDSLLKREVVDANATPLAPVGFMGRTITIRGRAAANVSAASYVDAELAADSIASAFGVQLATLTVVAGGAPLPTLLGGTSVRVKDSLGVERMAALFFVSPHQINYQIPAGTAEGIATVTITNGAGEVTGGLLNVGKVAPGVFAADASGKGWAAAEVVYVAGDGSQSSAPVARYDVGQNKFVAVPIDLARNDAVLVLYATGLRQRSALAQVNVKAGGVDASVDYAGAQGTYIGLDQVNVRLPKALTGRGEVTVELTVDGKAANPVRVQIK